MNSGTVGSQSAPFDELAHDYDASFTATRLGRWLRSTVWQHADGSFGSNARILEIGCGTGEDALHFASLGHNVVATDPSTAMLDVARRKAERLGYADRIEFRRIAIEQLAAELDGERFDGAFSNFGAMNCAAELQEAMSRIARLLQPRGSLVLVVMGPWVPWEMGWFLARRDWRRAFRRLGRDGANWRGMTISYPSPAELTRTIKPDFIVESCHGLGIVLPPTYASGWLEKRPGAFSALTRIESLLGKWTPLAAFADHYIIKARRLPHPDDTREGTN